MKGYPVADELWVSRSWNQPIGCIYWWIEQAKRSGTYTARQAARMFYEIACKKIAGGPEEVQRQLIADHQCTTPDWLHITERDYRARKQPKP